MLTVIFGAGASYDAISADVATVPKASLRMPLAKDLFAQRPLFDQALRAFPDCQALILDLRRALQASDPRPLEELLERLQDDAAGHPFLHRQLTALRLYLRRIISSCEEQTLESSSGLTNYVALLQRIRYWQQDKGESRVALLTFNYDRLLEAASRIVYDLDIKRNIASYVAREDLRIYKLHGSIDWARVAREDREAHGEDARELVRLAAEVDWTDDFEVLGNLNSVKKDKRFLMPALSMPTLTKTSFECPPAHLDLLRADLDDTDRLLVIGWRGLEQHFYDEVARGHLRLPIKVQVVAENYEAAQSTAVNFSKGSGVPLNQFDSRGEPFTDYMRDKSSLERLLGGPPAW